MEWLSDHELDDFLRGNAGPGNVPAFLARRSSAGAHRSRPRSFGSENVA